MKLNSVIPLFMTALLVGGCATSASKWNEAQQSNTISAYQTFLREHPDSPQAITAKTRMQQLELEAKERIEQSKFEQACSTGSENALNTYLKQYPSGKHTEEARNLVEQIAFKEAVAVNSEKALEAFLKRYPQGADVEEAMRLLEQLALKNATTANSEEAYESFLSRFPNSDSGAEVTSQLRKIRYEAARNAKTVAAYEEFTERYPQGTDSDELQNGLPAVRKWEQAKLLGEIALRMAPTASMKFAVAPVTGGTNPNLDRSSCFTIEQSPRIRQEVYDFIAGEDPNLVRSSGFTIEQSPWLKQDVYAFCEQLKAGADPNLVRISGFEPPGITRMGNGLGMASFGERGKVVPAEAGGMTLLEYCKTSNMDDSEMKHEMSIIQLMEYCMTNNLDEAIKLLEEHDGK